MKTKRQEEAYLLIDHRCSPGISPEFMKKNGLEGPAVGAGVTFESAMSVCHHCQSDIVLNPNRTRERAWCRCCDHYICDRCAGIMKVSGRCVPFKALMEKLFKRLVCGFKF